MLSAHVRYRTPPERDPTTSWLDPGRTKRWPLLMVVPAPAVPCLTSMFRD